MRSRRLLDVLVGIYVSVIVATASALVRWEAVTPTFSAGRAVAVGLTIAAVVALIAGTIGDLAERVTSRSAMAVIGGLALVYLPYLLLVVDPGSTQALIAGIGVLVVIPGFAIRSVANRIVSRQRRETATEIVVVTEHGGKGTRRWLRLREPVFQVCFLVLVVGSMALIGPFAVIERPILLASVMALFVLNDLLDSISGSGSDITVTTNGLHVDQCFKQAFTQWDECDGYRLTDGSVEIVRSRQFFSTQEFDREAISDEAALVDGVATYLPRLNEAGERMDEPIESYC